MLVEIRSGNGELVNLYNRNPCIQGTFFAWIDLIYKQKTYIHWKNGYITVNGLVVFK